MALRTQITATEYLQMTFPGVEPDFVRGEIVERPLPNYVHSRVVILLGSLFERLRKDHSLFPCAEIRVHIEADVYRVIDLAVFAERPKELLPTEPPLLAIEVVSPDDRHTEILEKLEDYRRWGVRNIWLADAWSKRFHAYSEVGLAPVAQLALAEYDLRVTMEDLLREL